MCSSLFGCVVLQVVGRNMKSEVQTPVAVNGTALLDVSPCSLVEVYHFLDESVPTFLENHGDGYIPLVTLQDILKVKKGRISHFPCNYIACTIFITHL